MYAVSVFTGDVDGGADADYNRVCDSVGDVAVTCVVVAVVHVGVTVGVVIQLLALLL